MTYEELKREAKRQGYKLVKIQEPVKRLPCKCGRKRLQVWTTKCDDGKWGNFFKCLNCGLESEPGKTNREAILNWNKKVTE